MLKRFLLIRRSRKLAPANKKIKIKFIKKIWVREKPYLFSFHEDVKGDTYAQLQSLRCVCVCVKAIFNKNYPNIPII
jgi:hypothetical protein